MATKIRIRAKPGGVPNLETLDGSRAGIEREARKRGKYERAVRMGLLPREQIDFFHREKERLSEEFDDFADEDDVG